MRKQKQKSKAISSAFAKDKSITSAVAKDSVYWIASKAFGDAGEAAVFQFFEDHNIPYRRFKVPDAISNTDFGDRRIGFTKEFKHDLLIDALARVDGVVCGVEVKTKRSPSNFVIDTADYDLLFKEFLPVCPVLVYFYMIPLKEIFVHVLRDPKAAPALQTMMQRDEPVYKIPSYQLRMATEVTGTVWAPRA